VEPLLGTVEVVEVPALAVGRSLAPTVERIVDRVADRLVADVGVDLVDVGLVRSV